MRNVLLFIALGIWASAVGSFAARFNLEDLKEKPIDSPVDILTDRLETLPDMYSMPQQAMMRVVPGASRGFNS